MTPQKTQPFIQRSPLSLKWEGAALLLFIFLTVLFRFRVLTSLETHYLGGASQDAGLYIWLAKHFRTAFFELPWFNTQAFFPYTKSLAWSDNFLLPAFFADSLTRLGLSFAAAYNFLLLSAYVLNGWITYVLSYRLTASRASGLFAGFTMYSFSFFTGHLGHPQLLFFFFTPLALLFFFETIATRSAIFALAMGLVITGAFLTTVYYAIFIALAVFILGILFLILKPHYLQRRDYAILPLAVFVGLLPLFPFALPYFDVRETFGARRLYEPFYFAADSLSYLSTNARSFLYGFTAPWSHAEAHLFPGFIVLFFGFLAFFRLGPIAHIRKEWWGFLLLLLALCIVSALPGRMPRLQFVALLSFFSTITFLVLMRKIYRLEKKLDVSILTNRDLILLFLGGALFFFILSLGPLGNVAKGDGAYGIYRLFYHLFPGVDAMRAVGRFGVMTIFFLALAGSVALAQVLKNSWPHKKALAMLFPLVLLENYVVDYPLEQQTPAPRPLYRAAADAKPGDAILILPFTSKLKRNNTVKSWADFAKHNVDYMNWVQDTDLFLVNGYSGQRSKIMTRFPRKFSAFPDLRSIHTLSSIPNLRYLIIRTQFMPGVSAGDDFLQSLAPFYEHFTILDQDEEGNYLLEFTRRINLQQEFLLRVPSYPAGTLTLSLQTEKKGNESQRVDIFLKDHIPGAPFMTLQVPADAEWHDYVLPLPETSDSVRPLLFTFSISGEEPLFLGTVRHSFGDGRNL